MAPAPWRLQNFLERLDIWIDHERPSDEIRRFVTAWIFSRMEDPYRGVRRSDVAPNLWFGEIPGTVHDGQAVACSYWIIEAEHVVRCDAFATLSRPI